jgi:predicted lipid-binding transport protein (Tim44 family)
MHMKKLTVAMFALLLGIGLMPEDTEARGRLGGGRNIGTQRQAVTPQKQATPPSQQSAQTAAAAPQAAGASRWFGPLAGLAAGLGLGWLLAQGGFGAAVAAMLMAMLAAAVAFAVFRLFAQRRGQAPQAQYAGLGSETVAAPPPSQLPGNLGAQPDFHGQFVPSIPSGFDVEAFLKQARRNFLKLQEANDRADLELLRSVTTPEMFEALQGDLAARVGRDQTDVVTLNASLIEVVTEGRLHWASVRFSGAIREDAGATATPFEEIWHLQKPVDGSSGWLLAGIQQVG